MERKERTISIIDFVIFVVGWCVLPFAYLLDCVIAYFENLKGTAALTFFRQIEKKIDEGGDKMKKLYIILFIGLMLITNAFVYKISEIKTGEKIDALTSQMTSKISKIDDLENEISTMTNRLDLLFMNIENYQSKIDNTASKIGALTLEIPMLEMKINEIKNVNDLIMQAMTN